MIRLFKQIIKRPTLANVSTLFIGTTIARFISALVIFIVARQLGLEKFGLFFPALSLAKLLSVFFSLGLDSWLLHSAGHFQGRLGAAVGFSLTTKTILGFIWLLVLVLVTPLLPQNSFASNLVILSGVSIFFEELGNTGLSVFKASLKNHVTVRLIIISQILLLLITLALAFSGIIEPSAYLWARIIASGVGGGISLFSAFRCFTIRFFLREFPQNIRETFPFGLSQGLAIIYERADITIIAYFLGKSAAGIYSPAISLMTTLFLVPTAVYEVMLPILSQAHANQKSIIPSISFKLFLLSAGLGILLGIALVFMAYPLVLIVYSAEFAASAPILVILSNVLLFKCLSFALASALAAVGWQGKRVVIQLIAALFNVFLNLLLVRTFGIQGVAYIYVLTEFVLVVGYLGLFLRWQQKQQFDT